MDKDENRNVNDPNALIGRPEVKDLQQQNGGYPHGMVVYDPNANRGVPDDEIDLRQIFRIIGRYKWMILSIVTLALVATAVITLLMRPVYRATALIEVKPEEGSIVQLESVEQLETQPQEYRNTQLRILQSESVAEAVIEDLNLTEDPELNGEIAQRSPMAGVKQVIALIKPEDQAPVNEEDAAHQADLERLARFSDRLSVSSIPRSDLFSISFDSFSPTLASETANSVVKEFVRLNRLRKVDSSADAKQYLQDEIERMQAKLEASEKELAQFARENQIVDTEDSDNIVNNRLNDLDSRLTQVKKDLISTRALLEQARANPNAVPAVLNSDLIKKLKEQRVELQGEYNRLSRIYKPGYPLMQQMTAQIEEVEGTINQEIGRIVGGIQSTYRDLQQQETELAERVESQKQEILGLQERSATYNILKREWESNKELYTGLLESMKEVGVATGLELSNIAVIDYAKRPVEQHSPKLALNLAIAGPLSLMFGIGLAFLLAHLDNTVNNGEEVERITGYPCLGMVPLYKDNKQIKGELAKDNIEFKLEFITQQHRNSDVAEAIRSIRANLMFASVKGLPKTILFTSTVPQEGKSTLAINMAAAVAESGQRTLLIDCDLRKPRVHSVFGFPSSPGLSDALISQNLAMYPSSIKDLDILTAGTRPLNPTELLGSKEFKQLLNQFEESYDHIIIDGAPLLGLADSIMLSTQVDGVVYVVKGGETNKEWVKNGVKRLKTVNAPVLGIVLNQVEVKGKDYGYYQEYYKQYGVDS